MKKLWSKQDRQDVIDVCHKWIDGNLTAQDIKDYIGTLSWAVNVVLPRLEKGVYISSQVSILVDDILEMDSISDEEKDQSILELLDDGYKEELQSLARKVLAQIEVNTQAYLKNAKNNGYCPGLLKDDLEGKE